MPFTAVHEPARRPSRRPGPSRPSRRRLVAMLIALLIGLTGLGTAVGAVATPFAADRTAAAGPQRAAEVVDAAAAAAIGTPLPHHVLDVGPVRPGRVSCFNVADERGVPPGVDGVVLNVTAVNPDAAGYVVVYPHRSGGATTPKPDTSTVNFEPGRDVASTTFVQLPPSGNVCHATEGGTLTRLVVDLIRYVSDDSGIELRDPRRLLDTRTPDVGEVRGPVPPHSLRTVQVTGRAGVPAGARAVIVNATVARVGAEGNLRLFPGGGQAPNTSVLNYVPGVDKANATVVRLSADGTMSLWSDSADPVEVIVDVLGWATAGSELTDVPPTRVLDTRAASQIGGVAGRLESFTVYSVPLRGGVVPSGATAVVLNVTAIDPTTTGNLRAYADTAGDGSTARPEVSMINYVTGRAIPNLVVVDVPPNGLVAFWSDAGGNGTVHLAVDVLGYLTS